MTAKVDGPQVVIVMGVSASGKSTVGTRLAQQLGVPFLEGDELHSAAEIAKMAAGHPLDDADRRPWLAALCQWIRSVVSHGGGGVVACSSLKRRYRDELRSAGEGAHVCFIHLALDHRLAAERIAARKGHFMPPGLLDSQFAILEPLQDDEPGVTVDAGAAREQVVAAALRAVAEPDG
ncbi:gluconokinase [Streptomyces sp. NPDC093982]|uniref:gluconokinase n=1 Tax=Streptomyces sp. NPDC093982 TaxID=3155077 RepID=UPI00343852ED